MGVALRSCDSRRASVVKQRTSHAPVIEPEPVRQRVASESRGDAHVGRRRSGDAAAPEQ